MIFTKLYSQSLETQIIFESFQFYCAKKCTFCLHNSILILSIIVLFGMDILQIL